MILKFIYTLFLGFFLVTFVGVGISAFYTGPQYPQQPVVLKYCSPEIAKDATKYTELKTQAETFDRQVIAYEKESSLYNRNVSTIAIVSAIIVLVASLTLFRKILLIADGLLLGGVFTLIYSIGRGFGTEDNKFRFVVVTIGFVTSLILGYIKFIKPAESNKKR